MPPKISLATKMFGTTSTVVRTPQRRVLEDRKNTEKEEKEEKEKEEWTEEERARMTRNREAALQKLAQKRRHAEIATKSDEFRDSLSRKHESDRSDGLKTDTTPYMPGEFRPGEFRPGEFRPGSTPHPTKRPFVHHSRARTSSWFRTEPAYLPWTSLSSLLSPSSSSSSSSTDASLESSSSKVTTESPLSSTTGDEPPIEERLSPEITLLRTKAVSTPVTTDRKDKKTAESKEEKKEKKETDEKKEEEATPYDHLETSIEPSWRAVLSEEVAAPTFRQVKKFLNQCHAVGTIVYPPRDKIFEALRLCPFDNVRVVILGQDPYIKKGEAEGLCFSVARGVKIPPSLVTIYNELVSDIPGFKKPSHGSLVHWAQQGVLLLNAALTVEHLQVQSHTKIGWTPFTDGIIKKVSQHKNNVIFLLWGSFARRKASLVDRRRHHILEAPHPSPQSEASFRGCRHFSQTNAILAELGLPPIDWQIPE